CRRLRRSRCGCRRSATSPRRGADGRQLMGDVLRVKVILVLIHQHQRSKSLRHLVVLHWQFQSSGQGQKRATGYCSTRFSSRSSPWPWGRKMDPWYGVTDNAAQVTRLQCIP
ncbi:unnamed protein product, partial [Musa textilis]